MDLWMLLFGLLVLFASLGTVLIPWHHETKKRYADWHHRMMMDAYWRGYNEAIEAIKGASDEQ
jgi:hypothetical protein